MAETAGLAWRFGRVLGLRGRVVVETAKDGEGLAQDAGVFAADVPVARDAALAAPLSAPMRVAATVGDAGQVRQTGQGAEFGGFRALVADDSEINCTILRTFLERLGFEVTLAADGVEALERWVPGGHDLLCMDIEMPNLDGLTAFVRMKAEATRRGIAMPMALAVTINAMTHEVTGYMEAGFDACLPKPFSRNDLVDLLRRRWPADAA